SMSERTEREATLRHALDHDGLRLVYQPIFNAAGELRGVEALLRLVADDGTLLPPTPYIAIAEETGLIAAVGQWVLTRGCRQVADWRRELAPELVLNVNMSGREVGLDGLAGRVLATLTDAELPASALALELTETALIDASPERVAELRQLLDAGVNLGVDDFGTGYSSLQYLRSLPVNFVKIDQSFVAGLPAATVDRAIVAAVATLCTELGLHCVAEGVETEEQRRTLRELNVGYLQGYLLARPESAADFGARLRAHARTLVPSQRRTLQPTSP
ncbi:MAG TPA: EAL domain-containing protein, partial [Mycobacteriales bacterium]|nr:EAL domain-containing protein [Mycobacteriales bacterium]